MNRRGKSRSRWLGRSARQPNRRGAATAELAIGIIPLLVIFVGTIDTCQMMFLKEDVTTIAFECARLGARPGVTQIDIYNRAKTMCDERGIVNPTIDIQILPDTLAYDECRITITAPEEGNVTFDMINVDRKVTVFRTTSREQFNYE